MTTLMSWANSNGEQGRCDAKCYNAKSHVCFCMCGGRNHGSGLKVAVEQTIEHSKEMLKKYEKRTGQKFELELGKEVQPSLFNQGKK